MCGPADAASIASERDGLLLLGDVLEELLGALKLPTVDRLGSLAGVLEGNAEIGTAGAGGLRRLDFGRGVSNLEERRWSAWMVLKHHIVGFATKGRMRKRAWLPL